MKTVFPNHNACAHTWAAQSQPGGRSGPLYFDGPTIYSYGRHYAIATFMRPDVVLFNSTGSTPTTSSKHKPAVYRALRGHSARVFQVPGACFGSPAAQILPFLVARYTDALECAARSRKYTESNLERAQGFAVDVQDFATLFSLGPQMLPAYDRDAIKARIAAQSAALAVERAAQKACDLANAIERGKLYDAALLEWRLGRGHLPSYLLGVPTALRISADGTEVETSRGASVPIIAARRLWLLIENTRRLAVDWEPPVSEPVGAFALREIRADGTAIVGCHELTYTETHALAVAQGWAS